MHTVYTCTNNLIQYSSVIFIHQLFACVAQLRLLRVALLGGRFETLCYESPGCTGTLYCSDWWPKLLFIGA
jgi:hypothetical protein